VGGQAVEGVGIEPDVEVQTDALAARNEQDPQIAVACGKLADEVDRAAGQQVVTQSAR
jgi:C-terminal processing protease CtpA/Prc